MLTSDHLGLLTISEAAEQALVAPATVRWWIRVGRLDRHEHLGRVVVSEAQLLEVELSTRASGRGRPRRSTRAA